MRQNGSTGAEIIQALIESSDTYESKTEYSKEKWLKKKQEKYYTVVEVTKPSGYTLCNCYFKKHHKKINGLRPDSLANMLLKTNINAMNKSVFVIEETGGLLVGAVAERMGGNGVLINMCVKENPNIALANFFNLGEDNFSVICNLQYKELLSISKGESLIQPVENIDLTTISDEKRRQILTLREQRTKKRIKKREELEAAVHDGVQALIIAITGDALPYVKALWPFLRPGMPFAIYSEYTQTLIECHEALKRSEGAIDLDLSESWFREYQVLPNRTHPLNGMSGGSGYVLTGLKVKSELGEGALEALVKGTAIPATPQPSTSTATTTEESGPNKKQKTGHEDQQ
eukprot:TRINITY_DN7972_c0_g1_i1.p1 TRINITY_DN7972_c0_g1~~TRINITY_DN7972_c0_g1_i1.p1  ORF type:complete len:345 (-),score=89.74 TRINITY_DN7972_c0_g1_i1:24-1058(-)